MKILIKEEKYMQYSTMQSISEQDILPEPIIGGNKQESKFNVDLLPDFLKEYLRIASQVCDAVPEALITALLPIIAVNIGNKVYMTQGAKKTYPNIYATLVGPSGCRKSSSMATAKLTMEKYNEELDKMNSAEREKNTLILNTVTQVELGHLLELNPARLLMFDEIGEFLKSCNMKHNYGYKENITKIFDTDNYSYMTTLNSTFIKNPALSILGCSTEGWIYRDFQNTTDQNSGFLQRFIVCVINMDKINLVSENNENEEAMDELRKYNEKYEVFRSIPKQYKIKLSEEANTYWKNYSKVIEQDIGNEYYQKDMGYAIRIFNDYFLKLCMIFTLMENYQELKTAIDNGTCDDFFANLYISEQTAINVFYLCRYYLQQTQTFTTIIEIGDKFKNEKRIVEYLSNCPQNKASKTNIMNHTHLNSNELSICQKNLEEQEAIQIYCDDSTKSTNAKKPTTFFKLTNRAFNLYRIKKKNHN